MKKLLSVLLCVVLFFSFAAVTTNASTDYKKLFEDNINTMRWAIDIDGDGVTVTQGQSFGASTMINYCQLKLNEKYADFNSEFYYIPADEFETLAKNSFAVFDLNALRNEKYQHWEDSEPVNRNHYVAEKNAYEFPGAGGMGDPSRYVVMGYFKNGSKYTVYSHFVYYSDEPVASNKIENKDYVVVDGAKWPVEYSHKTVVETDGTNVKFHSWEKVSAIPDEILNPSEKEEKPTIPSQTTSSSMPTQTTSSQTATSSESISSDTVQEKTLVTVAQTATAVLETEENVFPENTVVKVEVIEKKEEIKPIKKALKDVSEKFVVYEITATSNNVSVQPDGKVKATFSVPRDYDLRKVAVFYVSDDGKSEKLKSTVDNETNTVVTELSHFSTYVVAEVEKAETLTDIKEETEKRADPIVWIIITIIIVLLIGGGLAYYFLIFKKKA